MSDLLRVVLISVLVSGVVALGFALLGQKPDEQPELVGVISSINTPGTFVQDIVLTATSTDRATSTSVGIQNANRLTCFFGSDVDQGGQITYSVQVSSQVEAAQTTNYHSTSTPIQLPSYGATGVPQFVTAASVTASSTGTSTASVDLSNNIYPFFRVIADLEQPAPVEEIATSTVECITSY